MQDCKAAYDLTWKGEGWWSGYTYLRDSRNTVVIIGRHVVVGGGFFFGLCQFRLLPAHGGEFRFYPADFVLIICQKIFICYFSLIIFYITLISILSMNFFILLSLRTICYFQIVLFLFTKHFLSAFHSQNIILFLRNSTFHTTEKPQKLMFLG